jgi:hypothetical protein
MLKRILAVICKYFELGKKNYVYLKQIRIFNFKYSICLDLKFLFRKISLIDVIKKSKQKVSKMKIFH